MWRVRRFRYCRRRLRLYAILDECGVCGGAGIADGACDCAGNVLDACGVCGGSGVDADADGICDDIDDCVGQFDECGVCNGDGSSCADPCAAAGQSSPIHVDCGVCSCNQRAGGTVYRFYVNANDATDKLSAVFGNDQAHWSINTPDGIFNSTFNAWRTHRVLTLRSCHSSQTWQMTATPPLDSMVQLQACQLQILQSLRMLRLTPSISGYFLWAEASD